MAITEAEFRRRPFRCRRFTREEIETIISAAEKLDDFYRQIEGRPDSDLRNSMARDLRALIENDREDK